MSELNSFEIAQEVLEAVNTIRRHGYAVVEFSPQDLGHATARSLEATLISYAWSHIAACNKIARLGDMIIDE